MSSASDDLWRVLARAIVADGAATDTGYAPFEISRAYLEALSESLQLVHDLTTI